MPYRITHQSDVIIRDTYEDTLLFLANASIRKDFNDDNEYDLLDNEVLWLVNAQYNHPRHIRQWSVECF